MKRELTKFELMGIVGVVGIIICFFYVKKVYEPEYKRLAAVKKKYTEVSKTVENLKWTQPKDTSLSRMKEKVSQVESEVNAMKLLHKKQRQEIHRSLNEVLEIVMMYGLIVKSFSLAEDKKDKKFSDQQDQDIVPQKEKFNLVLKGNFIDLKRFIKGIIDMNQGINIENIDIVKKEINEMPEIRLVLSI